MPNGDEAGGDEIGGVGFGPPTDPPPPRLISGIADLEVPPGEVTPNFAEEVLRQPGLSSIPVQEARLGAAINQLLPVIQGSPLAVREAAAPQINQIRGNLQSAFDTISRRLGRFGGGQIERERGRALGGAAGQLQNVFAAQPAAATQQLIQTLSGFNPFLLAQPPLQTSSQAIPPDFGQLGQSLAALIDTAGALFAPTPGLGPTPFSNTLPGGTGSGINPATGQLIIGSTGTLGGGV